MPTRSQAIATSPGPASRRRRPSEPPVRRARRVARRWLVLGRLARDGDPTAAAIGRALRDGAARRMTAAESAWVERIEALRAERARSREVVRTPHSVWTHDPSDTAEEAVTHEELALVVSKPEAWGAILMRLIRELRPHRCVELGSCIGISAAYQAAALELNGEGTLITLEADPGRAALARAGLDHLRLGAVDLRVGRFQDLLGEVLADGVDFAFVDGHHDERATLDYFSRVTAARAGDGAVVILDDIRWSDGMRRAWHAVTADPAVLLAVDLGEMGLCVVGDGQRRGEIRVPLFGGG